MNYTVLKAIVLTAKLGSVTAAAKKLNKNRVQVSNWITQFEDTHFIKLFARSGNKTIVTDDAQRLIPYMENIIREENELNRQISAINNTEKHTITLGISYLLPEQMLTLTLQLIKHVYPDSPVTIISKRDEELIQLKAQNKLDIALICYINTYSLTVELEEIGKLKSIAVSACDHPLASQTSLTYKQLSNHTYIMANSDADVSLWEPTNFHSIIHCNHLNQIKHLVSQGVGFATLPYWQIETEISNGTFVVLDHQDALVDDRVGVAFANDTFSAEFTSPIKEQLKAFLAQLPKYIEQ